MHRDLKSKASGQINDGIHIRKIVCSEAAKETNIQQHESMINQNFCCELHLAKKSRLLCDDAVMLRCVSHGNYDRNDNDDDNDDHGCCNGALTVGGNKHFTINFNKPASSQADVHAIPRGEKSTIMIGEEHSCALNDITKCNYERQPISKNGCITATVSTAEDVTHTEVVSHQKRDLLSTANSTMVAGAFEKGSIEVAPSVDWKKWSFLFPNDWCLPANAHEDFQREGTSYFNCNVVFA